jgi:YidC/Oxa1 family membrane protein insertase
MAKLTPKVAVIRAKYKGRVDRISQQKMQQEIMELQQKEGYSMLSGCLPMLLQLPLIIFLYNVIRKPLSYIAKASKETIEAVKTLVGAEAKTDEISLIPDIFAYVEKYGTTKLADNGLDVSKIPDFKLFGINLADTPSLAKISWLVLIPVLAAAFQWFTMWVMKRLNGNSMQMAQGDDAQSQMSMRIMDLVMPLMTLFIAFSFSGMLGLYWIFQSIISILQTIIIAKVMPIPKFTEEEIKAIRKAQREQQKAQKEVLKQQPKFRSLHNIDDDDYDELPEVKNQNADKQKNKASGDAPEIKD